MLFEIRFLHADDSVRYVHEVECGSEESALALFKRLSHASVLELWSERGFVSRHDPNAPAESMFVLD